MEILQTLAKLTSYLPELVMLFALPAVLVVAGLLYAIFHAKKAYVPTAVGLGGLNVFILSANIPNVVVAWTGLYLALCALVSLLFLIPFGKKKHENTVDEMYEEFHLDLDLPVEEKEIVFEVEGEGNVQLDHVFSLIESLKGCDLSASDRLEVDALCLTLEGYRNRALTAEESRAVNDSLATVLKLTAKYKL